MKPGNNCEICVSVCASTIEELVVRVRSVPSNADLIEIRFDCLVAKHGTAGTIASDAAVIINKTFPEKKFIFTYRPKHEGGYSTISFEERKAFWDSGFEVDTVDLENDLIFNPLEHNAARRILSYHNFENSEFDWKSKIKNGVDLNVDLIKVAVTSSDCTDGIPLFGQISNKNVIPIAMGASGVWTRILGPAFGAPITYAASSIEDATAPGQITIDELETVYDVRRLDQDTDIYGIIGKDVADSLSPRMQNAAFNQTDLNAVYIPFQVMDLGMFVKRMARPETREIKWNLRGLSVTKPFKEEVIGHLDFLDPAAESIGAVNTIQVVEDKLVGFNTDWEGFRDPLVSSVGSLENKTVVLIGAGGAARACAYALNKLGARTIVIARNLETSRALSADFECETAEWESIGNVLLESHIAVNTTPLGSIGALQSKSPAAPEQLKNLQLAYDLVYNPNETLFLRNAAEAGVETLNGLSMLVSQGTRQFEIWTGRPAPAEVMKKAVSNIPGS